MDGLKEYMKQICLSTEYDIYIVGEVLRDYLLNKKRKNIDIVVKGDHIEIAKEFAKSYKDSQLVLNDSVKVAIKEKGLVINFSSMQGEDIIEDLENRDFTMDAMAVKVDKDASFDMKEIIDPFDGRQAIKNKMIKSIKSTTFKDHPLSMLRAVLLMAELGFELEKETIERIRENAEKIKSVPWEYISAEVFDLLERPRTYYYFHIMDERLHILDKIFPEIEPMKDVGRCDYHTVDAWEHSLYALKEIENIIYANEYFEYHLRRGYENHMHQKLFNGHTRMQLVKLAALFHDIGKPEARWIDERGKIRFRGHEIIGMDLIKNIADRLKLRYEEKEYLCKMVREHMWPLNLYIKNDVSGKTTYDLFKGLKEDTLDVLLISLADIIATRKLLYPHEEMGMYKIHIEYLANNYLTRFKSVIDISKILNKEDITKDFHIKENTRIEELLEAVRKAIFLGEIPPQRTNAIEYLKKMVLS